jgi:hypothetical protein
MGQQARACSRSASPRAAASRLRHSRPPSSPSSSAAIASQCASTAARGSGTSARQMAPIASRTRGFGSYWYLRCGITAPSQRALQKKPNAILYCKELSFRA